MTGEHATGEHVAAYHGLLGTVVEVRVGTDDADVGEAVERAVVDEMRRLERVFTVYDERSTLARWRRGDLDDPGPELGAVLADALAWQARSGGAFNPLTGALTQRWRDAAAAGVAPTDHELDVLAASVREPRYALGAGGRIVRVGDCAGLDLNAFAKGWIVDRALDAAADALASGAAAHVMVNAGGDLAHRGAGAVWVGVENPLRPFDNEPPLAVLPLSGAALATTGGSRRGIVVAGVRHSHVLDPRAGRPVAHTASATVLAADAATADVVATVAGVLPVDAAAAFVDDVAGAACLLVAADGAVTRSRRWPADP